jgi:hypothetical protein
MADRGGRGRMERAKRRDAGAGRAARTRPCAGHPVLVAMSGRVAVNLRPSVAGKSWLVYHIVAPG